jgi:hypothetical protein
MLSGFGMPGPLMIGTLEASLSFVAIWMNGWPFLAGWLVFKSASKWASWQHVMKLPERLDELGREDQLKYVRFRWAWSSQQLSAFLFGTLASIGAGITGVIAFKAMH